MKFSLLTYNVLYNNALARLSPILKKYKPDILCLQEVDTNEKNLKSLERDCYQLADFSNSFIKFGKIYGVATYYNTNSFTFLESDNLNLPRSYLEIALLIFHLLKGGNKPRTVLQTDFLCKLVNKSLSIFNIHLSLYGANSIRNKQLEKTLKDDLTFGKKDPLIITGDFNYFPYRRKKLENIMKECGLAEATCNLNYTIRYSFDGKAERYNFIQKLGARFIRKFLDGKLKVDYTFYRNLKLTKAERIDVRFSDHYPIIAYFKI